MSRKKRRALQREEAFNTEMEENHPVVLQALRIYAAIHEDDVKVLSLALEPGHIAYNDFVFDGETILHACARLGATNCIEWLLQSSRTLPDVVDALGRKPMEIAKLAEQKASTISNNL